MGLSNGQRLGSFEVLAPLGAGGMGEVYRARDTRLGRDVALKTLPESVAEDRDRVARFEQEARAASALNHPHIVTIHEIGRDAGITFVAMELVDGKTLRELMVTGALPVKRVLNVGAQVAEGLAKAHSAGIVHRDLKPENVMVSKDGFVKILDFGLAKLIEPDAASHGLSAMPTMGQPETHPGTVLGTVGYMSPEQASGEPLDYRSDQFSLGTILYEMATGTKAFQRKTAAETMSAIIREEPEPAGKLRPDLPPPVRWVIDRCLAKDRDERYASTRDLARDLAGLRDHITEASTGSGALAASPARPRPRWMGTAAALALAVATGILGWWIARRNPAAAAAPSFKRLTFQQGTIGNARFAPDGQTVIYGMGTPAKRDMLLLTRLDSPESKPFDFPGDILSISRTTELAIWRVGNRFGLGTLEVVPVAGGTPRPLVEDVAWAGADWDPGGKELAIVREVDGVFQLEFPPGKVLARGDVFAPRFSPDGREIVCWHVDGTDSKLTVFDRLGKQRRVLTSGWPPISGGLPCWRRDTGEVWFTASKPGETDSLWAVSRSGKVRRVARVPGILELYDLSQDGRVLMGHHTLTRRLIGLAPGREAELDLSCLDQSIPAGLSPDGTTLLITESGEGAGAAPAIYLRTTDGAPAARIGEGQAVALSPDKKWALARRADGGRHRLWLVPTGPGETRPLAVGDIDAVEGGGFTPDGKRIVFTAAAPGAKSRVYIADLSGGAARPLTPEGVGMPYGGDPISPDGHSFFAPRGAELVIFPLDGPGTPRVLPGLSPGRDRVVQWTADSRGLYVYDQKVRPIRVDVLDPETGARRPWKTFSVDPSLNFGWLRITPTGNAYVYNLFSATSELYVVEGLR